MYKLTLRSMEDRLKKFIDYLGVSINQFEVLINVGNGTIYHVMNGKNGLTMATILKISPLVEFLTAQLREKDARIETLAAEAALLRAQLEKNPTTISASTPMETSTSK